MGPGCVWPSGCERRLLAAPVEPVASSGVDSGEVALGEILALRSLLLNLHFRAAKGEPVAEAEMRGLIDMLARIKKSGKLRVGITEIVPWATHDKNGKLMGFSVDVARKLARDMRVEVEFYPDAFKYLIPDLLADRFDIIVSGFSIEPQRALLVNFSQPFNTTDVTLAANIKTAGQFTTLQEFNKPTLAIGPSKARPPRR